MGSEAKRPLLGITMGDPGGVGAEVAAKALTHQAVHLVCRPLVIGDWEILRHTIMIHGLSIACRPVSRVEDALFSPDTIDVLDMKMMSLADLKIGCATPLQGDASFSYIFRAIDLARSGKTDGIVTGPLNKEALNLAGHKFSGHTEILAEFTGTRDYAMMLMDGSFRVAHVSTHVSLREACDRVRKDRVLRVIELTRESLVKMGIEDPRIGVAGLNPHCGEGGLFGDEEKNEIEPAVRQAQDCGYSVEGPIPADTVFSKMKGGMYDAVIVMYHDQGHIPLKLIGFNYDHEKKQWMNMAGVNMTLGLPIVRTSVDHGTAYDIAGKGLANEQSMIEAIKAAARLVS